MEFVTSGYHLLSDASTIGANPASCSWDPIQIPITGLTSLPPYRSAALGVSSSRVGNRVTIEAIDVTMLMVMPHLHYDPTILGAAQHATDNARTFIGKIRIYLDRQANGALATANDLYQSIDFGSSSRTIQPALVAGYDLPNVENDGRFELLCEQDFVYDFLVPNWQMDTNIAGLMWSPKQELPRRCVIPGPITIDYKSSNTVGSGVVAERPSGNIVAVLSNNFNSTTYASHAGTGVASEPLLMMFSRTTFMDG